MALTRPKHLKDLSEDWERGTAVRRLGTKMFEKEFGYGSDSFFGFGSS